MKDESNAIVEWLFDFICLVGGTASMTALVVLLRHFDQTPLKPWIWGITLNGTISVISFVWKACMSLLIANSIGQLKWHWFRSRRQLADMKTFDEASRGGLAGFKLLVRTPWIIARITGLIVILSMAFDPFVQQLVSYPTTTSKAASNDVWVHRGVRYTMGGESQKSCKFKISNGTNIQLILPK